MLENLECGIKNICAILTHLIKFRAARIAAKRQKRFRPLSCRELDASKPVIASELNFENEGIEVDNMTDNSPVSLCETTGFINQDVDTTGVQSECYSELDNATNNQKVEEEDELLIIHLRLRQREYKFRAFCQGYGRRMSRLVKRQ